MIAAKIRSYYRLTKPGVLYGNAITALAGFLLASNGVVKLDLMLWLMAGTSLIIASACVINNYLDQDIDALMQRTKNRPLITGEISPTGALIFGIIIGIIGLTQLILFTNYVVVIVGIIGFIDYVFLYGALSKRRSVHGTLVGSISGATPILAGYVAVSGTIDAAAIILFLILFLWQMPEFYSIAVYRQKEYKAAGVPVISVVKGIAHTKVQIMAYTIAFVLSTFALYLTDTVGVTYLLIMAMLGGYWLFLAQLGFTTNDDNAWARRMFKFSLIILLAFCGLISIDNFLP